MTPVVLGLDLATASARCLAVDTTDGRVLARAEAPLPAPLRDGQGGSRQEAAYAPVALDLLARVVRDLGARAPAVRALSVTGTSGTVVPVDDVGAALGPARLYDDRSRATLLAERGLTGSPVLGRLVALEEDVPGARFATTADVVGSALTGGPVAGDTSHWRKAGIDLPGATWPAGAVAQLGIGGERLPRLVRPGTLLGAVAPPVARRLGLGDDVVVVAGMTDGCTAQLAAGAVRDGDTLGVLGTTLVLKAVSDTDVETPDGAVYSHLGPDGRYWPGGASNTGAGVLAAEFPGVDPAGLADLDRRVADTVATAVRYPLTRPGERFPVASPDLPPLRSAEPRSRLDAYRTVLEGVAFVERLGLERLRENGIRSRRHVLAGGASASPVWNAIRATVLAPLAPVVVSPSPGSAFGAAVLAAYALEPAGTPLAEVVDRLVPAPLPVHPLAAQRAPLDHAYRRFGALLEGSLTHA